MDGEEGESTETATETLRGEGGGITVPLAGGEGTEVGAETFGTEGSVLGFTGGTEGAPGAAGGVLPEAGLRGEMEDGICGTDPAGTGLGGSFNGGSFMGPGGTGGTFVLSGVVESLTGKNWGAIR